MAEEKYRTQLEDEVQQRTAELKTSRDQYFTLVENTPDVITRWDKDSKLVFANPEYESKTGLSIEHLLGKTPSDMGLPEEIALPYMDSLQKAFEDGKPVEHFNPLPTPDGEGYFYSRISPEKNAAGKVETVLAIARDITQIRKAELEIIQGRQFLQSVMDSSLDVIQVFDAVRDVTGTIIDFTWRMNNRQAIEQLGEVVGKSVRQQSPGIVLSGVFDRMVQVVESGVAYEQEQYYSYEPFPDNWFYLTLVKHHNGVILTTKDITPFKKAEAVRLQSLMLLQQSEEVARIGSWEYDVAAGTFGWSEGMYRLFNLPVGSPVNPETYLEYVIEEDQPIAQRVVNHLREKHEPLEETLRLRVSGQVLTFRIKAVVLRNEQGEPLKVLGIDLDISEVKRLEEENLQMRLNQQKALLLGILAAQEEERSRISESLHNGVGQLLYATKLNLDQVAPHVSSDIIKITKKLLDEAIQETRRVSHELVPIVLKDFGLTRAVEDLCKQYRQSSIEVNCDAEEMEYPLESYLELAMYRICQELLTNVTKHAEATSVDILLMQEEGELILKVRDNGKGINPEPGKKSGIGLRTIQDRIKLLNGTFAINTPAGGKGTQITVQIPITSIN
ncbi:PAS domain-containing sensor histidine kinase [Adhaeribacter arboris]